jgi:hypothetical protein
MAYSRVKTTVVERDGNELEWAEEISPYNDLLQALGIIIVDKLVISGGDLDPSVDGFPGSEGSIYFATSNKVYKKIGINDTDWSEWAGGGASYLKDLLDVSDDLNPLNGHTLIYDANNNLWTSKPICHPRTDYGLITNPADCGMYDYGYLT